MKISHSTKVYRFWIIILFLKHPARLKRAGMAQSSEETVDQFICRLRHQAQRCDFADVDEMIRDQVIEKCYNSDIKLTFLKQTGTVTLQYKIYKILHVCKRQLKLS